MKNIFLSLVALLLSFNAFSQYVITKTDTIFGKVVGIENDGYDRKNKQTTYSIIIEDTTFKNKDSTIIKVSLDSVISITKDNAKSIIGEIYAVNVNRYYATNYTSVGQELIKYGRLNNIASAMEAIAFVVTGVGAATLTPPAMVVGGIVFLVSWIVRTSSYRHVIEAGLISDGYYKNAMKPIQIIN